jgi:hypothetical protein
VREREREREKERERERKPERERSPGLPGCMTYTRPWVLKDVTLSPLV